MRWAVLCCVVVPCVRCPAGQPAQRHRSSRNTFVALCAFPASPVLQCGTSSYGSKDGEVLHTNFPEASACLMLMRAFQRRCSEVVISWLSPAEQ